jgi:hypothetical protein
MHGPTHGWSFRVPPGWPIPPAGWAPSAGWQPDPAWPAAPQGWVFWVPSQPAVPTQRRSTLEDYWPTPRRSQGKRAGLMALYLGSAVAAWPLLGILTGLVLIFFVQPWDYASDAAFEAAFNDKLDVVLPFVMLGAYAVALLVFGLLAQRAGYRGAGFLLALVPIYGYVVICRVLWRWTDIKHWQDAPAPAPAHLPALGPIGLPHHQPAH